MKGRHRTGVPLRQLLRQIARRDQYFSTDPDGDPGTSCGRTICAKGMGHWGRCAY